MSELRPGIYLILPDREPEFLFAPDEDPLEESDAATVGRLRSLLGIERRRVERYQDEMEKMKND